MTKLKDDWDLKNLELYNKDGNVHYSAYTEHLGHTIKALIRHTAGLRLNPRLKRGKPELNRI
jgi:hypothetical protein